MNIINVLVLLGVAAFYGFLCATVLKDIPMFFTTLLAIPIGMFVATLLPPVDL
jgi:hypothetical protein